MKSSVKKKPGSRKADAKQTQTRTIRADYLARVEGEGAMYVRLKGDEVKEVRQEVQDRHAFSGVLHELLPDRSSEFSAGSALDELFFSCQIIEDGEVLKRAVGVSVADPYGGRHLRYEA